MADGRPAPGVVVGTAHPDVTAGARRGAVFVFPGQGSQWTGMAAELLGSSPVFAAALRECADALAPHVDWSLFDVLRDGDAAATERTDVGQPVLWAVMVSLAAVWRSLGIEPAAVVGHSQGEIAAACVAGALSLTDGARIVTLRSQLAARQLTDAGGMLSVRLPAAVVAERLPDGLSIAAVNGPGWVLVAGADEALDRLLGDLVDEWGPDVRARRITVDYASHSPWVEPLEAGLVAGLVSIRPVTSAVPFYSAVTGTQLDGAELDGAYWYRNLRQPVDFLGATDTLIAAGFTAFVEVSPHPVLLAGVRDQIAATGVRAVVTGTLRRDEGGLPRVLASLAELYVRGVPVDWARQFTGASRVDLPTYAFQRERYWLDDTGAAAPVPAREVREAAAPAVRPVDLHALVRQETAAVLGQFDAALVEPSASFSDLGFDSAMVTELAARLADATASPVHGGTLFEHPTPAALAEFLSAGRPEADDVPRTTVTPADDPIAIVGIGCRYPGGVDSPEAFWSVLDAGADAISAMPADRGWSPEVLASGRGGGFLHDAGDFDAAFFRISPREALGMDPQQRLLLETGWEALERAAIDPTTLRGSATGVFFGAMAQDYGTRLHESTGGTKGYALTGTSAGVLSGRLAYLLGTRGPALTVDTACSSSLVALHLAGQALRSGECDLALAGGVTVMANPGIFVEFEKQGGLSPDGRCRSFAEGADGTGWAEGAGVLVLQRLSDAQREGREVLAVLRGAAVNSDGASNGLTAPSGGAQRAVIRSALAAAGLTAEDVDAVEAHGTGTPLGDPIEARALLATYGQERARPLWLGSLKSNLGHTQAAAGVAGVIKVVLAMRHGVLPKTLHADAPSSQVDWASGAVRLLAEPVPWPETGRPRRAGVSSFGISGTNAHVIVEQAPSAAAVTAAEDPGGPVPIVVSARSAEGLAEQAGRLAAFVADGPGLGAVGWSLLRSRTVWEHRAVLVSGDRDRIVAGLTELAGGRTAEGVVRGTAGPDGGVGIVFTGQGAQRAGMGRELYAAFPVYAEAFDTVCTELDRCLAGHVEHGVKDVVAGEPALLDETVYTQAGLFAVEVAMLRLLESFGVRPRVVAGHSLGELTAAYAAGVFSLPDAAKLVAARGRLMQALPAGGAMVAVAAAEDEVRRVLPDLGSAGVWLAAVNGPAAVVLSGTAGAVAAATALLAERGHRTKPLVAGHAFHSGLVEPMLAEFAAVAATVEYHAPAVPIVSTVTGALAEGAECCSAEYWVDQVRRPVRFADAVAALLAQPVAAVVEAGPDGVLTAMTHAVLDTLGDARTAVALSRRDRPGTETALAALAGLFAAGADVDWTPLFPAGVRDRVVALPTTAFRRSHYWLPPSSTAGDVTAAGQNAVGHPVLSALVDDPRSGAVVLTGRLSVRTHPWLAAHVLAGAVVVPGSALLELVAQAGDRLGVPAVRRLELESPLVVPEQAAIDLRIVVAAGDADGRAVTVHSRRGDGPWTRHAAGVLEAGEPAPAPAGETWPPSGAVPGDVEECYDRLAGRGHDYGPGFRCVTALWHRGAELFAEVTLPGDVDPAGFALHPAVLDAALHPLTAASPDGTGVSVPSVWTGVVVHAEAASAVRVHLSPAAGGGWSLRLTDHAGTPVLTAGSVTTRPVAAGELA
ncbi:MAG: acyltransferase domain-containing protein, partial [Actinoallomurus sp.]